MKEYGIMRRAGGEIVRHCSTYKQAQKLAWAMNDLCGNQTAFKPVHLETAFEESSLEQKLAGQHILKQAEKNNAELQKLIGR